MTTLLRLKVVSDAYIGGPGVNVLHFSPGTSGTWTQENVDGVFEELLALWTGIKDMFPNGVTFLPDEEIQEIDVVTGNIIGVWTQTGWTEAVYGTNTGQKASRGNAITVAYATDIWHEGKRLRGRSFLGPASEGISSNDGQVNAYCIGLVEDNYVAITSGLGPRLAVYHRPASGAPSSGYYGDVVAVRVNTKPGNLRSRRD